MDEDRRNLLFGIAGAALLTGAVACSRSENTESDAMSSVGPSFNAQQLQPPKLPTAPLLNRARASQIMLEQGVDALICARPTNIYYLTNHDPLMAKMGIPELSYAILPRDETIAPILVLGQFAFYLGGTQRSTPNFVDVRLYTAPAQADAYYQAFSVFEQINAEAFSSFLPNVHSKRPLHPFDQRRRELTLSLSETVAPTSEAALLSAVKDLALRGKRVAVDDGHLGDLIERAEGIEVSRTGEDLIRTVRLQKTDAEIALARYAAQANAEAALAAAKTVRDGATYQDLRKQYAGECADRLLTPVFMVIDGSVPETAPGEIEEGRSFLIDCVSQHQGFHGDYGRTVCVGEPTKDMQRATSALANVWDDLLPQLKPGMRYSEISALATHSFAQWNSDAGLICNPHSVGLRHTDEPSMPGTLHWAKDDHELVEGMVLSVDLPMVEIGLGGSGHLEDLVLITADGAELLNDTGDRVITV